MENHHVEWKFHYEWQFSIAMYCNKLPARVYHPSLPPQIAKDLQLRIQLPMARDVAERLAIGLTPTMASTPLQKILVGGLNPSEHGQLGWIFGISGKINHVPKPSPRIIGFNKKNHFRSSKANGWHEVVRSWFGLDSGHQLLCYCTRTLAMAGHYLFKTYNMGKFPSLST